MLTWPIIITLLLKLMGNTHRLSYMSVCVTNALLMYAGMTS